jgi:hypothetical protein
MKLARFFVGLLVTPLLLTGCSQAGSKYYKEAVADVKQRVVNDLNERQEKSQTTVAPKEYTMTKFGINYSDGYIAKIEGHEHWVCVVNYSFEYNVLDVNAEEQKEEKETSFVFYSKVDGGELVFESNEAFTYNDVKDAKGSKHIVYEAQKY